MKQRASIVGRPLCTSGLMVLVGAAALAGCAGNSSGGASGPTATGAAASSAMAPNPVDISGFWVRTDQVGAGSHGAMTAGIKPAELTAEYAALAKRDAEARAEADRKQVKGENGVYKVAVHCDGPSVTFMMQHSGAIDIVQSRDVTLIVPEHPGTQTIYMDGRKHPDPMDYPPSGEGHSVGRWEGSEFVVSTVGMRAGGGIPGGGRLTSETELTERFILKDPDHMVVRFTWTDPKIYLQPHSYEFTYQRQPADSYAFESWCDVTDPLQGQSIVIRK